MMASAVFTIFAALALAFNLRAFHRATVSYAVARLVYGHDPSVLPSKERAVYYTAQSRVRAEALRLSSQGLFFAIGAMALLAPLASLTEYLVQLAFITAMAVLAINGFLDDRSSKRIIDTLTPPGSPRETASQD